MHYDCHMLIRKNLNTTFAPNSNNKKIIPLEAQEPLYFKNEKQNGNQGIYGFVACSFKKALFIQQMIIEFLLWDRDCIG